MLALQVQSNIVGPLSAIHAVHREKGLGIGESFAATLGGMQRRRNMHCLPTVFCLAQSISLYQRCGISDKMFNFNARVPFV
jgi:hypothetical protein